MAHSPERRQIFNHLVQISNVGPNATEANPGGDREQSPRSIEHNRIQGHRHVLTDNLVSRVLVETNDSYQALRSALTSELREQGVPVDEYILLDALATILETKRDNVQEAARTQFSFVDDGEVRFASWPGVFTSRLWPVTNPPWYYPHPSLLWNENIATSQLMVHRDRAISYAATYRVSAMSIEIESASSSQEIETSESVTEDVLGLRNYVQIENANRRHRLERNAATLESFAMACEAAIQTRQKPEIGDRGVDVSGEAKDTENANDRSYQKPAQTNDLNIDRSFEVSAFELKYPSLMSLAVALADAEMHISAGNPQSAVDRIFTALHAYLKELCKELQPDERTIADPVKLLSYLLDQHSAFQDTSTHASHIRSIRGSLQKILSVLKETRNHGSLAHPNIDLLANADAWLVVNTTKTLMHYVRSKIEKPQP